MPENKVLQFIPKLILPSILFGAFVLRIIGANYGLPQQFIGDEFVQVAIALKMLDARALLPNFPDIFYHQPLSAYISTLGIGAYLLAQILLGFFHGLAEMRNYYSVHSTDLLAVVRSLSALSGLLTAYFMYLIGRDLFSRRVGIIAAFFGMSDFLLVYTQHSGRVWGYMPFFIALSLWAGVRLYNQESVKNYLAAAGATLLAAANLLPGIITFVPALISNFSLRNKKLWLTSALVAIGAAVIVLMNPRGIGALLFRFQSLSGGALVKAVAGKDIVFDVTPQSVSHRVFDALATVFNFSPVYLVLAIAGLIFLFKSDKKKFVFAASFPLAYYIFIGPFFGFGWVARALVPLSVGLGVVAAYGADRLVDRFIKGPLVAGFMIFALGAPSLATSLWFDYALLKSDTRTQAVRWIYENLPPGSKILSFSNTDEVINENRAALELLNKVAPDKLNTRQRTLLASPEAAYSAPSYFAWNLRRVATGELPENFFKINGFKYYMRVDWGYPEGYFNKIIENKILDKKLLARFASYAGEAPKSPLYLNVHNMTNPLKSLIQNERFGPVVEIYEVKFK